MNSIISLPKLIELIARASSYDKALCDKFIRAFSNEVGEALAAGGVLKLKGFGQFKVQQADGIRRIVFIPDKEMAEAVNAPFACFDPVELAPGVSEEVLAVVDEPMDEAEETQPELSSQPDEPDASAPVTPQPSSDFVPEDAEDQDEDSGPQSSPAEESGEESSEDDEDDSDIMIIDFGIEASDEAVEDDASEDSPSPEQEDVPEDTYDEPEDENEDVPDENIPDASFDDTPDEPSEEATSASTDELEEETPWSVTSESETISLNVATEPEEDMSSSAAEDTPSETGWDEDHRDPSDDSVPGESAIAEYPDGSDDSGESAISEYHDGEDDTDDPDSALQSGLSLLTPEARRRMAEQQSGKDKSRSFPWFWVAMAYVGGMAIGFALGFFGHDYITGMSDDDTLDLSADPDPISTEQVIDLTGDEKEMMSSGLDASDTQAIDADSTEIQKDTLPASAPVAPADSAMAPKLGEPTVYDVITPNNNLNSLAQKHYGNKVYWVYIFLDNQDKIKNPNNVIVGTKLRIPPKAQYDVSETDESANIQAALNKQSEIFTKYSSN